MAMRLGRVFLKVQRTINSTITMTRILKSLIQTTACLLFALTLSAHAADKKADPAGTWIWTMPGRNGGEAREVKLKLKLEGEKLTGTVSGRQGQEDTAIEDAKLSGEDISFKVTREFNGNKFTAKYSGKLTGDSIKGKIETERDGNTNSRDWEAKRAPAK